MVSLVVIFFKMEYIYPDVGNNSKAGADLLKFECKSAR